MGACGAQSCRALIEERSKLSSSIERLQAKLDSIPEAANQLAAARGGGRAKQHN